MSKSNVLVLVSGSIATFKTAAVVSDLIKKNFKVRVVCTKSALKFVGAATFEGLTGEPVWTDTFEAGRAMDHIHLARWADVMLLCPASAHTLNKLAVGLADNMVGALFLAKAPNIPFLIAPAMNSNMYQHPSVQNSLATLQKWGCKILPTESGALACGEYGEGRLLHPEEIIKHVESAAQTKHKSVRSKILITSGATREMVDGVRYFSNVSTGRTGALLADKFVAAGFEVTYLHGQQSALPHTSTNNISFLSFSDLDQKLKERLSANSYTAVIHAAAVSDYSVESLQSNDGNLNPKSSEKIPSHFDTLNIKFKKNFKIANRLREYSKNKNISVVAFKLTSASTQTEVDEAVKKVFQESQANFVVHNDLVNRADATTWPFTVYSTNQSSKCSSQLELAQFLITQFELNLKPNAFSRREHEVEI